MTLQTEKPVSPSLSAAETAPPAATPFDFPEATEPPVDDKPQTASKAPDGIFISNLDDLV